MKKWLFNPFVYIAGWQALLIGWLSMAFIAIISFYSNTHFDGAIDIHHVAFSEKLIIYVLEQLIAWICPMFVFFILAHFISRSKFRLLDIAGTFAIARIPTVFAALVGFVPFLQQAKTIGPFFIIINLLIVIVSIWMIALMYNGFSVSINVKGNKAVIGFIGGLIIAEVLSKFLNHYIQIHFR